MKKIKVIQYAMMFIALWTTLYLIDSIEVSKKEFIAAFVLVTVVSVNYICFRYYEDRKQNKDSLRRSALLNFSICHVYLARFAGHLPG